MPCVLELLLINNDSTVIHYYYDYNEMFEEGWDTSIAKLYQINYIYISSL